MSHVGALVVTRGDKDDIGEMSQQVANTFNLLPLLRDVLVPTSSYRATYAIKKFEHLNAVLNIKDIEQHVEFGYKKIKLAIPYGPADGRDGMKKNTALVKRTRELLGPDGEIMLDCWMAFTEEYTEQLAAVSHTLYGLEVVPLRYFNVFGPRQDPSSPYSGVISIFASRLLGGAPITVHGDGEQTRDFVYVDDVVQANMRAMFGPYAGPSPFNVGGGGRITLNALAALLGEIVGARPSITHGPARAGDIRHSAADITAIRRALAYEPQWTTRAGLEALIASRRGFDQGGLRVALFVCGFDNFAGPPHMKRMTFTIATPRRRRTPLSRRR